MSKGIMEMLKEGTVIDYDPSDGITMGELSEWFQKELNRKRQPPEYILSKWEAENLPLGMLNWLGENNRVLCSLEVANIVKNREASEIR